jgi:iron complex outermembrane receptor protein
MIATPAFAQQVRSSAQASAPGSALEEIVVTARRREEAAQTTPISVAAVSGEALERSNIQNPADLSRVVAGLVATPSASNVGGATAFIRGIGSTESSLAVDPSIGMYRDGIYLGYSTVSGNTDLTTVERVEVLRGPQGTLFGRNTTGGAINVVTRAPAPQFGLSQMLRYGRYNELQSTSTVDTGEFGNSGVSAVATFSHRQRDGYVDDPTRPNSRDPGAFRTDSLFLKVRGAWGALTADYVFDRQDYLGSDAAFQITAVSPFVASYFANSPGFGGSRLTVSTQRLATLDYLDQTQQRARNWGHALTAQVKVSDALTLKSISAWRRYEGNALPFSTGDAGLRGLTTNSFTTPVPVSLFFTQPKTQTSTHYTEEVQALGDLGPVYYTLGAFYLHQTGYEFNTSNLDLPISQNLAFPVSSTSEYRVLNKSKAVYGQVSYTPDFLQQLELTGGVRYTEDQKAVTQIQTPLPPRLGAETFKNTTYAVSVKYQWTPEVMTFARMGTGVRAGGFNIRAGAGQDFVFKPERARSYEAGLKSEFFDRRVRLNAGAFVTRYRDLQITTLSGLSNGNLAGQTFNADATYKGGEVELAVVPTSGLTLSANLGYVDPKYRRIFFLDPATGVPRNYASQAKFPYVPKWNANAAIDYEFAKTSIGSLVAHVDYSFVSKRYFHASNLPDQAPFNETIAAPATGLFNGRLSLVDIRVADTNVEISAWVNNIANKHYRVAGIDFGTLGFAGNVYGVPRTIGIDLKLKM